MRYALLFLIACSSPSKPTQTPAPTPAEPTGGASEAMTEQACQAQGGRVHPSIGGGDEPHCVDGETEIGTVRTGIEGGWCCKKN
ncbi:MAG TPA: hypothetical protein VK427_07365 [Kofleriaceae bacterium]|nr:hypothetical protein [Kofleriaceae bacterium]